MTFDLWIAAVATLLGLAVIFVRPREPHKPKPTDVPKLTLVAHKRRVFGNSGRK